MSVGKDFEAFAIDLFSPLGPIRIKRMFGAAIVYRGDLGFALLDDQSIWIKVDDVAEPLFLERLCPRFTYPMKDGGVAELPYRQLPHDALDDPEEACRWAQVGLEAALRKSSRAARPGSKGRR